MDKSLYRLFFQIQKKHWWFVAKKKIVLNLISRYLPETRNQKILDIGCGSGLMLNALENIGQTCGMDMSDDAISFSKEIFGGTIRKGMLPDNIPYDNDSFSLIVALDVIEHVDEDTRALAAIRSRLIEGGKAVITVPAYMFLWSAHDDLNEHKRRYTLTGLAAKLSEAGFNIEKISYFNTLLFPPIYIVRMLNNVLKREGASDIEMPGKVMNYLLEKIFSIEKYLLRFMNLPFGVSILAVVRK
ncbi:ubiquinone biosynthesis O-methyltransferase [mine drainage metagenome]|uniref:Ubiquinone biosynthesis O-methyltransferase n=1 Tax=mine drainage metagenome TaxID=410659 RepID=A0A1J5SEB0_9ZZZZ